MRQDTDQYQNGAKSLLNRRMLIGGGHVRRPGSWWEDDLAGDAIIADFIVNQTTQYILAFTDGLMTAYLRNVVTGHLTLSGTCAGPWTGDIFKEMDWVQRANVIFLTHISMIPQRIERTSTTTWVRTDFAFAVGPSLRPEQPYLKLTSALSTLQPGAVSGSVALFASEGIFVSAHIGTYVRYLGKAMLITSVSNSQVAVATVIEFSARHATADRRQLRRL